MGTSTLRFLCCDLGVFGLEVNYEQCAINIVSKNHLQV